MLGSGLPFSLMDSHVPHLPHAVQILHQCLSLILHSSTPSFSNIVTQSEVFSLQPASQTLIFTCGSMLHSTHSRLMSHNSVITIVQPFYFGRYVSTQLILCEPSLAKWVDFVSSSNLHCQQFQTCFLQSQQNFPLPEQLSVTLPSS